MPCSGILIRCLNKQLLKSLDKCLQIVSWVGRMDSESNTEPASCWERGIAWAMGHWLLQDVISFHFIYTTLVSVFPFCWGGNWTSHPVTYRDTRPGCHTTQVWIRLVQLQSSAHFRTTVYWVLFIECFRKKLQETVDEAPSRASVERGGCQGTWLLGR